MIQSAAPVVYGCVDDLLHLSRAARAMPPLSGTDDPAADAARWLRAVAERGDRGAFAALFSRFAPRVKAYLLRLGLPDARAEELAQESLLAVWRKAALYDPAGGSVVAWVFAIARNLRIDAARRDRLGERAAAPDPLADLTAPCAGSTFDAAEQARRVRAALAALPAEQAAVIRLSFFDDRPHGEIEQALGIPLGTVKSRLRLAMAKLRSLLGDAP